MGSFACPCSAYPGSAPLATCPGGPAAFAEQDWRPTRLPSWSKLVTNLESMLLFTPPSALARSPKSNSFGGSHVIRRDTHFHCDWFWADSWRLCSGVFRGCSDGARGPRLTPLAAHVRCFP